MRLDPRPGVTGSPTLNTKTRKPMTKTLKLTLTGNAEDDSETLTIMLDRWSLDSGQSMSAYASYLSELAGALRERAAMAEQEAEE
jgi:hypothetical protein